MNVIVDQVALDLVQDRIVCVRRFGTMSPYQHQERSAYNLSSGKISQLPSSRSVRLHPHEALLMLLRDRRGRFLDSGEKNP